jgi:hypothetical protein
MTREILEIFGDKIGTSRILLMTKINNNNRQQNPTCDKIARPYFHFSLTSQFDVIIIIISVLSHADIRVPAAGLQ